MRRLNFIWYILMMVLLPLSIVILSGNIVLRLAPTYVYHFNDTQVVSTTGGYTSGNEYADAIQDYFNSISKEPFQVYETNGEFQDPIFDELDVKVMGRAKFIMTITLIEGLLFFITSIAMYIYLMNRISKASLRGIGFITAIITFVLIGVEDFLMTKADFRAKLYDALIRIDPGDKSLLKTLIGTPFEKTYIIFFSVAAIAITCIFIYVHYNITREKRIFS